MALPAPDNYNDWREFARVLISAMAEDEVALAASGQGSNASGEDSNIPPLPDGWAPVWWSLQDANLYLANKDYDPPTAAALFQIDTQSLADTAVSTQKLQDGAVDFYKIFDGAVGSQKLADLAVTNAKLGFAAVGTANILDAAIVSAKIGDAQVLTAKIGDAQIVTAKIADLAVNDAKIANLAVTSAKIALLAVGNAHIQDAAITRAKVLDGEIINAKIGNIIQSTGYNGTNGWQIDKAGNIRGTAITILNPDGSVAFASGSKVNLATQVVGSLASSQVSGLGILAALNSITPANTSGFGALALKDYVAAGSNAIPNSDMTLRNTWAPRDMSPGYTIDPACNNVFASSLWDTDTYALRGPTRNVALHQLGGTGQVGSYYDLVPLDPRTGNFAILTCAAGDRLVASVFTGTHRCQAQVFIFFLDTAGNVITATGGAATGPTETFTNVLGPPNYSRTYVAAVAPAGTAAAYINLRKLGTLSGSDSYIWYAAPMLERAQSGQTEPSPYVPGAGDVVNLSLQTEGALDRSKTTGFGSLAAISLLNSGNIGTYIAGAAIGGALIANAAIGTAHIDNAAITTAKIGDAQITSAKIISLDATKINASSLSSITAEIGTLMSSIGTHTVIRDGNGDRYYDNGVLRMQMGW